MSEATKLKIEKAIETLNYQPNIVARSLKQKSTFTIGIIVANLLHSFSTQVIRELELKLQESKFNIIVCNADDEPVKECKHIEVLLAKQVDGLILFPTGGNIKLYQQLHKSNFPIVFIDRKVDGLNIPSILLDNVGASENAVQQFVSKGYENISIITNPISRNITPRLERIAGYRKALAYNGLDINEDFIQTVATENVGTALDTMLSLPTKPNAIIAGNDRILVAILEHFKKLNIKIPNDVALIGYDEVSFASLFSPPINTIEQPTQQMAHKAAEVLLNLIHQHTETIELEYRFQPIINVRESI